MKRFKNILLVCDGDISRSTALLRRGFALARTNNAQLTVTAVVESLPLILQSVERDALCLLIATKMQEILEQTVDQMKLEGISVRTKVLIGTPFLQIIREVLHEKIDLVMIHAEGSQSYKELIFGSTALHLLRKCPAALWVMHPAQESPIKRIAAAVDPDPRNPVKQALNQKILQLADSLRLSEKAELHIVHAWSIPGEHFLRTGVDWLPASFNLQKITQEAEEMHNQNLFDLLQEVNQETNDTTVHVIKGEAADVISDTADSTSADLIVMGTVNRTVAGFLIGNTAEKVLHRIKCSVLAVKPDGFVTPVQLKDDGGSDE